MPSRCTAFGTSCLRWLSPSWSSRHAGSRSTAHATSATTLRREAKKQTARKALTHPSPFIVILLFLDPSALFASSYLWSRGDDVNCRLFFVWTVSRCSILGFLSSLAIPWRRATRPAAATRPSECAPTMLERCSGEAREGRCRRASDACPPPRPSGCMRRLSAQPADRQNSSGGESAGPLLSTICIIHRHGWWCDARSCLCCPLSTRVQRRPSITSQRRAEAIRSSLPVRRPRQMTTTEWPSRPVRPFGPRHSAIPQRHRCLRECGN